jgi:hypothetical protein
VDRLKALRLLVAVIALLGVAAVAWGCGGSDPAVVSSSATAGASHPDPEPDLRAIVDKLNSGDLQSFYDGLSADRRASTTVHEIQGALNNARALVGAQPKLEIASISAKRINGDDAEVDATLNLALPSGKIPVTDTAILKWEDGSWHLADHFLDQALAVLGLGGGSGSTSTPAP